MLSEVQILFVVLAAVYGWECACWLRHGRVGFRTWLGRSWRRVHPGTLAGNQRGGFVLAPPLPPLGYLLQTVHPPVSLSEDGVLVYTAANPNPGPRPWQSGAWLRFDAVKEFKAFRTKVFADGRLLFRAASPGEARALAGDLACLHKQNREQRAKALKARADACMDADALGKLWTDFQDKTRRLLWLANGLFVFMFAAAPAAIWFLGVRLAWPGLAGVLVILAVAIAFLFRRAHREFYPRAEDERFTQFIIVLLSPATAVRAVDLLSRPLLERFHPLAAAQVLCDKAGFREFAGQILRDLTHPALPVCPGADAQAAAAERENRERLREAALGLIRKAGVAPEDLLRPPARRDPESKSYCPRCLAQFTRADGRCADCGGLPVAAF